MSEEEANRIRDAITDIIGMVPFVLVFDHTSFEDRFNDVDEQISVIHAKHQAAYSTRGLLESAADLYTPYTDEEEA